MTSIEEMRLAKAVERHQEEMATLQREQAAQRRKENDDLQLDRAIGLHREDSAAKQRDGATDAVSSALKGTNTDAVSSVYVTNPLFKGMSADLATQASAISGTMPAASVTSTDGESSMRLTFDWTSLYKPALNVTLTDHAGLTLEVKSPLMDSIEARFHSAGAGSVPMGRQRVHALLWMLLYSVIFLLSCVPAIVYPRHAQLAAARAQWQYAVDAANANFTAAYASQYATWSQAPITTRLLYDCQHWRHFPYGYYIGNSDFSCVSQFAHSPYVVYGYIDNDRYYSYGDRYFCPLCLITCYERDLQDFPSSYSRPVFFDQNTPYQWTVTNTMCTPTQFVPPPPPALPALPQLTNSLLLKSSWRMEDVPGMFGLLPLGVAVAFLLVWLIRAFLRCQSGLSLVEALFFPFLFSSPRWSWVSLTGRAATPRCGTCARALAACMWRPGPDTAAIHALALHVFWRDVQPLLAADGWLLLSVSEYGQNNRRLEVSLTKCQSVKDRADKERDLKRPPCVQLTFSWQHINKLVITLMAGTDFARLESYTMHSVLGQYLGSTLPSFFDRLAIWPSFSEVHWRSLVRHAWLWLLLWYIPVALVGLSGLIWLIAQALGTGTWTYEDWPRPYILLAVCWGYLAIVLASLCIRARSRIDGYGFSLFEAVFFPLVGSQAPQWRWLALTGFGRASIRDLLFGYLDDVWSGWSAWLGYSGYFWLLFTIITAWFMIGWSIIYVCLLPLTYPCIFYKDRVGNQVDTSFVSPAMREILYDKVQPLLQMEGWQIDETAGSTLGFVRIVGGSTSYSVKLVTSTKLAEQRLERIRQGQEKAAQQQIEAKMRENDRVREKETRRLGAAHKLEEERLERVVQRYKEEEKRQRKAHKAEERRLEQAISQLQEEEELRKRDEIEARHPHLLYMRLEREKMEMANSEKLELMKQERKVLEEARAKQEEMLRRNREAAAKEAEKIAQARKQQNEEMLREQKVLLKEQEKKREEAARQARAHQAQQQQAAQNRQMMMMMGNFMRNNASMY